MSAKTYKETFDNDQGGWWYYINNAQGPKKLEHQDGTVTSRSPWWIDYNHAPPGAGYIHMLFCLTTAGPITEHYMEVAGPNRFVSEGFNTDFANARLSLRLKGELENRGARLVLLVQSKVGEIITPWALTSQPFEITKDWSQQTVTCLPDADQWTCLGGRHDRQDYYDRADLAKALQDVNVNIMLILFPLTIEPMGPIDGDMNILRPEKDYPVWRSKLPEGYVTLDTVEIEFDK